MSVVPISGTKELASRTTGIAWRTRSDTFVLFPLLELTLAVAQHHAVFFEITLVREIYCPPVLGWTRRNAGGGYRMRRSVCLPFER